MCRLKAKAGKLQNRAQILVSRKGECSKLEVAIGRAGPGQQWARPKPGRAKIGQVFSSQNFNSPARPKNRAGRAKQSF